MEEEYMQNLRSVLKGLAIGLQKSGHPVDLENLDEKINQFGKTLCEEGNEEFNGFTSLQMHAMDNYEFEPGCPVQLNRLTEEQIQTVPIMKQALFLMNTLAQKEIRLTKKGSLPMKMVSELYDRGNHDFTLGLYPQMIEDHNLDVQVLRRTLSELGLIKTRTGKLSLTAKGSKMLNGDHNELMRGIILFLFKEYNTAWYDKMGYFEIGNMGRLYSLWLLHHFGSEWRPAGFYEKEYFKAFEGLKLMAPQMCKFYPYRVFHSFLAIIGVCEISEIYNYVDYTCKDEIRKTPVLDMMFSFEEPSEIKG